MSQADMGMDLTTRAAEQDEAAFIARYHRKMSEWGSHADRVIDCLRCQWMQRELQLFMSAALRAERDAARADLAHLTNRVRAALCLPGQRDGRDA